MSETPPTTLSSSNYQSIFNLALDAYREKTKSDLASHPLLSKLESCISPDATLALLREQIPGFDQARNGDDKLMRWLNPAVKVLCSFSATFSGGTSLVSFGVLKRYMQGPSLIYPLCKAYPPAGVIFTGIGVLLSVSGLFPSVAFTIPTLKSLRQLRLIPIAKMRSLTSLDA